MIDDSFDSSFIDSFIHISLADDRRQYHRESSNPVRGASRIHEKRENKNFFKLNF